MLVARCITPGCDWTLKEMDGDLVRTHNFLWGAAHSHYAIKKHDIQIASEEW